MKQSDTKNFFEIDCDSLRNKLVSQQHRSHANAKRMRGDGFGAVWKTTQGPTSTIQAFETLELDER
jgi:hypothetical protein